MWDLFLGVNMEYQVFVPCVVYQLTVIGRHILFCLLLRGRLLNAYLRKRLPMSFTLLIEHDEDQKIYPVRDRARS